MQSHGQKPACNKKQIFVNQKSVSCPQRDEEVLFAHPRVFISVDHDKPGVCPYCGTKFILETKHEAH